MKLKNFLNIYCKKKWHTIQKDDNKPVYFPSINKKYQQYLKMSCYMTYKQIKEEKNEQK